MNWNLLSRRIHYWLTPFLAVPVLIILVSGILLQVKKQSAWVQPPEQRGKGSVPTIGFETMLQSIRQREDLAVSDWNDVHRIDIRPSKGMAKVTLKSGWEVQVDLEDGSILQTAIRRSDWIESIHDGSFFWGDATKLGIFLPSAVGLTVLWITGLWMFWLPISVKRKRKARAAATATTGALVVWLSIGHSIGHGQEHGEEYERPNIVFILADDLGWGELGCYGQEKLQTPNIDRLAREGMRFTQHYSGAPVCAPSRCVLMTGKHLGHAEIRGNLQASRRFPEFTEGQYPLSENAVTFVSRLKEAGYATGAFGKWGLGPVGSTGDPNTQGFDVFFGYNCQAVAHSYYPSHLWRNRDRILLNAQPISGHPKGATGNEPAEQWRSETYAPYRMIEEAEEFLERNADHPFFLYLPFIEPHVAMHPPQASLDRFPHSWDSQPYRGGNGYIPHPRPRAAYAAMIHDLDSYVGRILQSLERHGISDKTLVILTSDNGTTHPGQKEPAFHVGGVDAMFFNSTANLKGYKGSVYEGGIRVPMIARLPGRIPAGVVNDSPSYFADWFPTLCEFTNIEVPAGMDGVSLRSMLLGHSTRLEDRPPMVWVFPEYGGQVAVRWGNNKLVRRSLAAKQPGPWELFDLSSDPGETVNLAEIEPETVAAGRAILLQQMADNPVFPVKLPLE